ncbi:TPA: transcriptional regulator [Escherichia coli]|nr:transcriptional regulator [Escherichia coli]
MFDNDIRDLYDHQSDGALPRMRRRIEGRMSNEQFDLLVELSSIHSPKVIMAMHDHLVKGDLRKVVCQRYGVNAGYLSVCIARLHHVEWKVSKLARFYR